MNWDKSDALDYCNLCFGIIWQVYAVTKILHKLDTSRKAVFKFAFMLSAHKNGRNMPV